MGLLAQGLAVLAVGGCGLQPPERSGDGGETEVDAARALLSAEGRSSHYVAIRFDQAPPGELLTPAAYEIEASEGRSILAVNSVALDSLDPSGTTVILTTDPQMDTPYTVRVPAAMNYGQMAEGAFFGSTTTEFQLGYAISLDNTTVLLTFGEAVDGESAQEVQNYVIRGPDLQVIEASAVDDNMVQLTTSPQSDQTYQVRVANLRSSDGQTMVDPDRNAAPFVGIDPVDVVSPALVNAEAVGTHTIALSFSEPLENFVDDPASYTVDGDLVILGVEPNRWNTQVQLHVPPMTPGTTYTVGVSQVEDRAGNPIDPLQGEATFIYRDLDAGDPTSGLPRLTGAVSTGNTSVVVTYNRPMSYSALLPANYEIVQANVQPEAGRLWVQAAAFLEDSRTAVELTTLSQNELVYVLTAVNVEDTLGNQIAPPELLVNPAQAEFRGTPSHCRRTCASGAGAPGGLDGNGSCGEDGDCDDDAPCDSEESDCESLCQSSCGDVDSDGDGLTDAQEQRGWRVLIELSTRRGRHGEREIVPRDVTSDPFTADTDGDQLPDDLERQLGSDPREADSDADRISDNDEFNYYFSSLIDQDSDDDGVDDNAEVTLYFTSPVHADTDGDGFDDSDEVITHNRNPLVADLPEPQVTVGEFSLSLDITSSYTDEEGSSHSVSDSTSSTFAQSQTQSLGTSATNAVESELSFGQSLGYEASETGYKVSASANFGQSFGKGYSSTVDRESSSTSQQEHQRSVTRAMEISENRSVTRDIEQAVVQASVNLSNNNDIAFTIQNIELSMMREERSARGTLRPVATLVATQTDAFNMAPLEQNRGPLIFESTTVFSNRVDDLMREPTGLLFKVVNYDVLDEAGRNLVFTAQDVVDRTVAITLDFGDGRTEVFRVATASGFDGQGLPLGISMQRALEIAGIFQGELDSPELTSTYATTTETREGETIEALARVRDVANSEDGTQFWAVVSSNTALDSSENFSELNLQAQESVLLTYTSDVDGDALLAREEYLYGSDDTQVDTDGDGLGDYDEVRVGWTVSKVPGLPYLAFPSPARADSDLDGLDDPGERDAATDPNRADTDEDGLSDTTELRDGYTVTLSGGDSEDGEPLVLNVAPYSDWVITAGEDGVCDSDAAGDDVALDTPETKRGKTCIAAGPDGVLNGEAAGDDEEVVLEHIVPGPDGVCDTTARDDDVAEDIAAEIGSRATGLGAICISAGLDGVLDTEPVGDDYRRIPHAGMFATDPLRTDTDLDGIGDGRELVLGTNPNSPDAGGVTDVDGDGLFDAEEERGWWIGDEKVSPSKDQPDSDDDGLPDVFEWALGTNPKSSDTDGDGLSDHHEFNIESLLFDRLRLDDAISRCDRAPSCSFSASTTVYGTDPTKSDTDGDGLEDKYELETTWGDPLDADIDVDGLNDGEEHRGPDGVLNTGDETDPTDDDTDDDGTKDGYERSICMDNGGPCRNPTVKDAIIDFAFTRFQVVDDCDDAGFSGAELRTTASVGPLALRLPNENRVAVAIPNFTTSKGNCAGGETNSTIANGESVDLSYTTSFLLREGQTFSVESNGAWAECDDGVFANPRTDELQSFSERYDLERVRELNTSAQAVNVGVDGDSTEGGCSLTTFYTVESRTAEP
ncbi:MAG: hypothetical protein OXU20_09795 [Myxococcales bacterium]|nr:hypothetical protein [Myxococcales bacterium]